MGLRISWEDRREEIYEAYIRHGRNARQTARLESQAPAHVATRQTSEPAQEGGQLDAPLPVTVIYPELARPVVAPPPPAIYRVTEFLKIVDDPEDDQGHEERFCYATGRMNQRILDALRRGGHWTE